MDLLGGYGSDDSGSSGDEAQKKTALAAAASKLTPAAQQKTSRRGKRIVSLHAVLPTHILDQLEKGTGDFDSDDDEDVPAAAANNTNAKAHAVVGKDEGLSSFLSELKSTPTNKLLVGNNTDEKPAAASQPLGHAFTTTTSVVVSRGKQEDDVVDIHAQKPKPAPTAATITSTLSGTGAARAPAPRTAAPRPSAVSVPRPSAASMNRPVAQAAPPPGQVSMQQAPYYRPEQQQQAEEPKVDARRAKKRSRKEMEKALRQGDLDALDDNEVTTLEAEGSVYVPQEETYAVPRAGAVRNTAVRMYDPRAGTDVVTGEVSGKQRGKHQINQLLASAANLELQRARGLGTGGVKNKRADAKRKYGW